MDQIVGNYGCIYKFNLFDGYVFLYLCGYVGLKRCETREHTKAGNFPFDIFPCQPVL